MSKYHAVADLRLDWAEGITRTALLLHAALYLTGDLTSFALTVFLQNKNQLIVGQVC